MRDGIGQRRVRGFNGASAGASRKQQLREDGIEWQSRGYQPQDSQGADTSHRRQPHPSERREPQQRTPASAVLSSPGDKHFSLRRPESLAQSAWSSDQSPQFVPRPPSVETVAGSAAIASPETVGFNTVESVTSNNAQGGGEDSGVQTDTQDASDPEGGGARTTAGSVGGGTIDDLPHGGHGADTNLDRMSDRHAIDESNREAPLPFSRRGWDDGNEDDGGSSDHGCVKKYNDRRGFATGDAANTDLSLRGDTRTTGFDCKSFVTAGECDHVSGLKISGDAGTEDAISPHGIKTESGGSGVVEQVP